MRGVSCFISHAHILHIPEVIARHCRADFVLRTFVSALCRDFCFVFCLDECLGAVLCPFNSAREIVMAVGSASAALFMLFALPKSVAIPAPLQLSDLGRSAQAFVLHKQAK